MSPQTAHTTREEALISAEEIAEGCCPHRMASVWIVGPQRYVVTEYIPGDEKLGNCLVLVLANGTRVDPRDYPRLRAV